MLGWGVPMPIPIRSRRYDENFWLELLGKEPKKPSLNQVSRQMGFTQDDTD